MKIAVLVKQIPEFESLALDEHGRLVRDALPLEMNAYCRRAVAKGVEIAQQTSGSCTVVTLGPPRAVDVLREAIAWGAERGVRVTGVHVTGAELAGSDTLATAGALSAALAHEGPFDLVLAGRSSLDADTGQVGPGVAELLDLPFASGVKQLELDDDRAHVRVRCEEDDGASERTVTLPALLSTAERLCEPCKVDAETWQAVPAEHVRVLGASDLGRGPFGSQASRTTVGEVKMHEMRRDRLVLAGPFEEQLDEALALLAERGALSPGPTGPLTTVHGPVESPDRVVAVVVEPDRPHVARELLGAANALAGAARASVVALTAGAEPEGQLAGWGADGIVRLVESSSSPARVQPEAGPPAEEEIARAVRRWAERAQPWALLVSSTSWGREVASRVAVRLGAGLTGDAVDLEVELLAGVPRLVAWKPALSGHLVVAIRCSSEIQMATVRPGVLPHPAPRRPGAVPMDIERVERAGRVHLAQQSRDDDIELLARAERVIGVGSGVPPEKYELLAELAKALGGELAASRRVTDKGWMAHARQIGITGRSISPRLYMAIAISGKYNHMVGVRSAGTVLAVNHDPQAPVFDACDIGIVGDWQEVVRGLIGRLQPVRA